MVNILELITNCLKEELVKKNTSESQIEKIKKLQYESLKIFTSHTYTNQKNDIEHPHIIIVPVCSKVIELPQGRSENNIAVKIICNVPTDLENQLDEKNSIYFLLSIIKKIEDYFCKTSYWGKNPTWEIALPINTIFTNSNTSKTQKKSFLEAVMEIKFRANGIVKEHLNF